MSKVQHLKGENMAPFPNDKGLWVTPLNDSEVMYSYISHAKQNKNRISVAYLFYYI